MIRRLVALAAGAVLWQAAPALADPHGGHHGGGMERGGGWGRGGGEERGGGRFEHGAPSGDERGGPPGGERWDERRYNGYYVGQRWYYGPPSRPTYGAPGYRPGFTPWRRGSYLPPDYQSFVVDDYWRYHLRRPPGGYRWVQAGDEFLLVSIATGLIFDVVVGN
jgi:Ni/Co efflux regulator RcnB